MRNPASKLKPTIRGMERRMAKVFLQKNWKALAAFYADDAVLLPPHTQAVHGKQQIVDYFSAPALTISEFEVESEDIQVSGSLAINRGNYTITFTAPGTTATMDDGKYLWVLRKAPKGKWQIVIDAFSSNHPPK